MSALQAFKTPRLSARRITFADLAFVEDLMTRPEMNAHKPDPTPPSCEEISETLTRDLDHWSRHGFGRHLVLLDETPIGMCGLSLRGGFTGLNLSYHLSPDHWGQGHATALVEGLVDLAQSHLRSHAVVFALVRPANPGSIRVLEKCGFAEAETLMLSGAPSTRYLNALDNT